MTHCRIRFRATKKHTTTTPTSPWLTYEYMDKACILKVKMPLSYTGETSTNPNMSIVLPCSVSVHNRMQNDPFLFNAFANISPHKHLWLQFHFNLSTADSKRPPRPIPNVPPVYFPIRHFSASLCVFSRLIS